MVADPGAQPCPMMILRPVKQIKAPANRSAKKPVAAGLAAAIFDFTAP
jgi:hypothetical protein